MLHREHNIFQNYTSCGGTAVHFTFENPLFTPENQPFTLHRGALSNSTAAVVHRGDVPLPSREKKIQTKKPSFTKNDKENMCGTGAQICDTMLTYITWFFVWSTGERKYTLVPSFLVR